MIMNVDLSWLFVYGFANVQLFFAASGEFVLLILYSFDSGVMVF